MITEKQAQDSEGLIGHSFLVGHEEEQVTLFGTGGVLEGLNFFRFDEFLSGAFDTFASQGKSSQSFGALLFGQGGQIVDFFTGVFGATRGRRCT